jgi:hypothetical protein
MEGRDQTGNYCGVRYMVTNLEGSSLDEPERKALITGQQQGQSARAETAVANGLPCGRLGIR